MSGGNYVKYACLICHNYYGNKSELQLHLTKNHEIGIAVLADIIFVLKNIQKSNINALLNNTNDDFKSQIIFNMIFKNYSIPFVKNLCNKNNLINDTLLAEIGSQTIVEYLESLSCEMYENKDYNERGSEKEKCNWCNKSFSSKIILLIHEENSHNFRISSLMNLLMQNIEPNTFSEVLEKNKCKSFTFKKEIKALFLNNGIDKNNNNHAKENQLNLNNKKIILNNSNSCKNNNNKKNLHRTKLLDNQLKILWKNFNINCSPNDEELETLAKQTSLDKKVIKHWFRNTLFKERQKNIESPYNFNNPPMSLL